MKTQRPLRTAAAAVLMLTGIALAQAGELGNEGRGREGSARFTVPTVLPADAVHVQDFGRGSPRTPALRTREADRPAASQPVERFGRA